MIDPVQLGKLEVGWWRAHNDHDKPKMAQLLVQQNVALYGFTPQEAKQALRQLVEGVNYHDTRDWKKAIEAVAGYYQKVKEKTGLTFNPQQLAELEVGWWKLHDELENNPDKSQLAKAFAQLYSTQYGVDTEKMMKVGQLKAEAIREHDLAEDPGTPPDQIEKHWDAAGRLLIDFYGEIKNVIG